MSEPVAHWRTWITPMRYLVATNIVGAVLGFVKGVYVARVLGPEALGLLGIIAGINTSVLAFLDVRLNDLASKVFYQIDGLTPEAAHAYQAGVLWLAWCGAAVIATFAALLAALVGNLLVPLFTAAPFQRWWLPVDAATLAVTSVGGSLFYLLRFSREFRAIGNGRVAVQLVGLVATLWLLTAQPNISGAIAAGLLGGVASLAIAFAVSWRLWSGRAGLPLAHADWKRARAAYRQHLDMLFYGNLLGYSKLLQRSLDVLVVARFTDDRETGLYKLARTIVDNGLAILQDALYQVYFPSLLELFTRRAAESFRALSRRLLGISALITAAIVAGEALLLPFLVPLLFGAQYRGVEWPMIILTLTFVFIVGFYTWLWAIFTGSGRLRGYTAMAFLSVLVQYAVMYVLFQWHGVSAAAAMWGALAYYFCLIPGACWLIWRHWREFLPVVTRAIKAEVA